jgi:hypothetical protein
MAAGPRAAMIALAVLGSACAQREPITSCDQRLDGTWRSDHHDERWMILDGRALEAYPLVPDGPPPRAMDLQRTGGELTGDVSRRYMQRGIACIAKAPVRVTKCTNDVLELVLSDPPAPAAFEPCSFPRPDSSRRERWRRE